MWGLQWRDEWRRRWIAVMVGCLLASPVAAQTVSPVTAPTAPQAASQTALPAAIKAYVQFNAVPIESVAPDVSDNEDLEPIASAIGDARIVMLGEQDHGDGPTFGAKTRLVKYLHEQKGFDVLVFEDDFFALSLGFDAFWKSPDSIRAHLHEDVYSMWTACQSCRSLFDDYIPGQSQGAHPLLVAGMDGQMDFPYSVQFLGRVVDSMVRTSAIAFGHDPSYARVFLPLLDSLTHPLWYKRAQPFQLVDLGKYLAQVRTEMGRTRDTNDVSMVLVENLIMENKEFQAFERKDAPLALRIRDEVMAKNLRWLVTHKYRGQKVIVWAANNHISKFPVGPLLTGDSRVPSMGKLFTQDSVLDKETYVIGFTAYSGDGGRLGLRKYAIDPAPVTSFEAWINPNYAYAFVDFTKFKGGPIYTQKKFEMRYWYYRSFAELWNRVFDGIFFVRETHGCVYLP